MYGFYNTEINIKYDHCICIVGVYLYFIIKIRDRSTIVYYAHGLSQHTLS